MQNAKRLSRAIVDRHRRDDTTGRELEYVNAERVREAARCERAKIGEKRNWIGGSHAGNLPPHATVDDVSALATRDAGVYFLAKPQREDRAAAIVVGVDDVAAEQTSDAAADRESEAVAVR